MATERELNILIKAKDLASKAIKDNEEALNDVGKALLAVGAAGVAGFGMAVKTAADFEKSMSRVGALSRATDEDLARLTETAKELGSTTEWSATQAAEGMQYLSMAGFSVNETIAAMPGLLATASAGQIELGRAADIVSNILSGFQIQAEETGRVADILTATFTSSNTTLEMLGETMKYVAPIASAAGMSMEDMAAATGLMGNAGIQGTQAGTSLRAIIMRLQAPTNEAAAAMQRLGINVRNADGSMKRMPDILAEFEKGLAGVSTEEKDMALKAIIGMEAQAGFMTILNEGSDTLRDYSKELANSGGIAKEIADKQLDNLHGAITILKSGLEGAAIAIGDQLVPYMTTLARTVTGLVERFNNLDPSIQQMITRIGLLITGFSLVAGAIAMIIPMLPGIAAGISLLLGPFGLIIGALAALSLAFINNIGGIRDSVMEFISPIVDAFILLMGGFEEARLEGDRLGLSMEEMFGSKTMAIVQMITNFKNNMISLIQTGVDFILQYWTLFLNNLLVWWNAYGPQILAAIQGTWNVIQTVIMTVIQALIVLFEWAWPYILQIIQFVMGEIVPFLIEMWTKILDFLNTVMPPMIKVIQKAWEYVIEPLITNVMDKIWNIIKTIWGFISSFIENAMDFIMGIVKVSLGILTMDWDLAWDGMKQALSGALGLIKNILIDFVKATYQIGKDIIQGIIDGVGDMARALKDAIVGAVFSAIKAAKAALGISSPSKVFMEMGEFSSEGLAIGIEKAASLAERASQDLAAATIGSMSGSSLDPGVVSGRTSAPGSGSQTVILQFEQGSISLPGVQNGEQFVDELQGISLRQAFKSL